MLIFAKDISQREPRHSAEEANPELKKYMEYQRSLFPYTIVRGGLDLAYKELDDILQYIDNDHVRPEDSQREDYPADIPAWYRSRFPWTGSFLEMEDMHALLVRLIKAMDSFRTYEVGNTYHWVVLYDAVHNIVRVYNELLSEQSGGARDINLSKNCEVVFDDFINNYWPHLEFMILSQPDYPHAPLMERNRRIEEAIKSSIAEGKAPLEALESAGQAFDFDRGTLALLRRDALTPDLAELEPRSLQEEPYQHLSESPDDASVSGETRLDRAYQISFEKFQNSVPIS